MSISDTLPEGAFNGAGKTSDDDFDWSDIASGVEASPENTLPRTGTSRLGRPRGRPRKNKRLDDLQVKLSQEMFQAGTLTGLALPTTGYYIAQESDSFTKAIIQLSAKRPEWIDALEHLADIGPGLVVGRTALGIGASFAVDRGRADPEKKAMMFLGVTAAYNATHGEGKAQEEGSAYSPPPAGAFVPIT